MRSARSLSTSSSGSTGSGKSSATSATSVSSNDARYGKPLSQSKARSSFASDFRGRRSTTSQLDARFGARVMRPRGQLTGGKLLKLQGDDGLLNRLSDTLEAQFAVSDSIKRLETLKQELQQLRSDGVSMNLTPAKRSSSPAVAKISKSSGRGRSNAGRLLDNLRKQTQCRNEIAALHRQPQVVTHYRLQCAKKRLDDEVYSLLNL